MSEATQSSTSDAARRGGLAFVTSRPVAITMFMIAIAVFGLVSLKRLPMDLLPEISYPTLTVRTAWPGAAPEDIEDRVSVRIQESLATLPNLVRTSSVSRAGYSDVVLEYQWGADMTFAVQDVRDKLDSLFLPSGSERPIILRYDPNLDPTLRIGVSAPPGAARGTDSELIQLRWIAENKLKRELETMAGVAAVQVRGGLEEEVRVRVDPKKLEARSIDLSSIAQRLAAENLNASGGAILEGSTSFLVRTLNEFEDLTDIEQLPIVRRGETSVRLGEVATVERTYKKREVVTRLGDSEAVEIAVYREAGANIVEVADNVKLAIFGTDEQRAHTAELVEKGEDRAGGGRFEDRGKENYLAWRLRREATIEVLSDQSNFIRSAIDDVRSSAIIGAVLAVVVMWFFLRRLSTTVIVALAIPISVIVTFAPMFRAGVSLNIMSLGGLALGIGMLVDNAIVVLESITRCREEGDGLRDAALRGVREVSGAIVASTLTTVAVFAPIVFVHGIAGQIFGDQALTVVSSLLVSLLVAVLFIPMLASRPFLAGGLPAAATARPPLPYAGLAWSWSTGVADVLTVVGRAVLWILAGATMVGLYLFGLIGRVVYWATWPFRALFDLGWGALERGYPLALRASLRHPIVVLLATGVLGWAAFARVGDLGLELLPEIHQGEFTAHVGLSVDSPLANTDRVLRDLAREVGALDEVALTALITGVEADTLTRDIEGEHTGRMTVRLAPGTDAAGEDEVLTRVRRILESHPEVRSVDVSRPTPFVIDAPLAVEVTGHDLDRMGEIASEVEARISALRDLTDVRSTMRVGHPEARVVFDREKTLEYGLDLGTVSNLLRSQLLGEVSTRLTDGDDRIDIRVQGDEAYLATLEEVLELSVNPESPRPLPLSSVARVELVRGPAEIRRIGNSRAVVVSASGTGLDLGGLNAEIEDSLAGLETPDDIFVELGGQKRELDAGRTSMIAALLLAIFLVYVVMASQFESLVQPLIIMLTVPLAGVGVVFTLDLLGIPLSVIVFIGAILLAGIVVNNAIVLVDRINQQRRAGMPLHESIEEAGRARLRPILMTTLTTALGLLPLTGWLDGLPLLDQLATGAGSEIRAPMAITVIAGLASSTALTLVLIPVVYSIVYRQAHRGEVAPLNAPRGFYRLAVDRPVGLFVAFLTLLVVGVIAYVRIPLEMMPSGLSSNELYVWISHPGASAQENEREVVRPIEDQIRTLSGIAHVYSNAESDEAGIEVVYDSGVDMALAKAELRDRLERVRPTLPDTVNRIFVWSWSQSELPLMWFAVTYDSQGPDTDYLVDTVVQRRLEAVDGVTRVQIYGMLDDAIEVRLDEEKVKASRLDVGELIGRLARDNFTQPLGQVDDGGQRVLLRSDMRFKDLEEVEDFPIGNGQRISDVGRVVRSKGVRDRLSRINGRFAYFGEIRRENQANVVDVSHRVKQALDELERDPATRGKLAFHVLFAQGDFIESSLSQLRSTALWGGALAAAVLLLFLRRVRVTLVVALSIPVSALLSLAYVYYTGGSFNILTMTGITLGIGMLVDNSVVVIENIVRLHNEGLDARFAASTGVRDVGLAVSLATLTTVVVFLPLIFMTSNPQMRIMFGSLGLPLCASLLFSLMVALVFLPVVTARIIGPRAAAASKLAGALAPIARVPVRSVTWLLDGLRHPLHLALCAAHHVERAALRVLAPLRWPLAAGLVAFAVWRAVQWSGAAAALGEYPGAKAFGEQSKGVAGTVVFAALVGAGVLVVGVPRWRRAALAPPVRSADSLAGIDSFVDLLIASNRALLSWTLLHRIQASALATLAVFSVAIPMSKLEIAAFGEDESRARMEVHVELEDNFTLREASEEFRRYEHLFDEHKDDWGFEDHSVRFDDDSGRFTLYWAQALKSDEYDRVRRDLMAVWPTVPGHTTRFYGDESIDTRSKTMVTFRLQGPEPDELERLGLEAMDLLATVDGLTDLTSPLQGTPPQVRVKLDSEQAWSLGVTADIALQNIAWALRGFALPRYHEPGREIPFFIGYDEEQTAGLDTLRNLEIYTQSGAPALGSFAALEFGQGQQSIRRVDGQISFSIQGRVEEASRQREVSETGLALLRGMEFPRGFSVAEDESVENRQAKEMEELKMAMRLSVVLVFLLMGILFESVLLPFSVLFTIPFAIVGALWTLLLTGTVLDSIGWIGVIILIGVVVNNGIVLIDRIHRLRLEGVERAEAVVEGSASRVRPILMTAMTTIFGLLPMTVAEPPSDGIDYRALATCVAGGLAFSTFFTLWVVPLAYTLMDDLGHALARHRSWVLGTVGSRRTTSTKPVEST